MLHIFISVTSCTITRDCTGHGKPGKSWNLSISFSKSGKSLKIEVLFDR